MDDLTDVGAMLEDFASTYTVTRAGAVEFDTTPGRPTAAAPSTLSITASAQPLSNKDLQRLPEGLRTEQIRKLYTETPLLSVDDAPQPDTIDIDDLTWQVESIEPWGNGGFFKVIVRKVG